MNGGDFVLVRYSTNGTADAAFGTAGNGSSLLPEFERAQSQMGLAIDPQGFIAIDYTSYGQSYVARLTGP